MTENSWIFDLDNTLYPARTNLFSQVDLRMRDFISSYLNVQLDEARRLQKKYFHEDGTTLKGLMTHHNIDPKPYLDFVHDIDISAIEKSDELSNALGRLSGKKYIFTNASSDHAERIMNKLGVAQHFDGIFDIVDAGYNPKPHDHIYDDFLNRFQVDPKKSYFFEDMARNLKPAHARGMTCVWVKTQSDWAKPDADQDYIHHETDDLISWLNEHT